MHPASDTPGDDILVRLIGRLAATGVVQLHNARGGLACNSSSSHSIIILPPDASAPAERLTPATHGYDFGWQDFCLRNTDDKIAYLTLALRRWDGTSGQDVPYTLLRDAGPTGAAIAAAHADLLSDENAYVDHQSVWDGLPDTDPDTLEAFTRDMVAWLRHPRVAIVGGGDGGSDDLTSDVVTLPFRHLESWRVRRDELDGQAWWVLFNTFDGTKLRLSTDVDQMYATAQRHPNQYGYPQPMTPAFTPAKAPVPELVDVKVTDACPFETDCGFCYMGSTRKGQHADPQHVQALVSALGEMGVFEIAIGGGEPTLWPGFDDLITHARSVGVVPNVTTKNLKALAGPTRLHRLRTLGALAFSVNDARTLDALLAAQQRGEVGRTRADWEALSATQDYRAGRFTTTQIAVQCIPDLLPADLLVRIIDACKEHGWRLTLLGFKTTGRGAGFAPPYADRPPGWWLALLAEQDLWSVAIDTALAGASVEALNAAGIPDWTWHTQEGTFSAYVDAVTQQVGPSSYAGPSVMVPLDLSTGADQVAADFRAAFARM